MKSRLQSFGPHGPSVARKREESTISGRSAQGHAAPRKRSRQPFLKADGRGWLFLHRLQKRDDQAPDVLFQRSIHRHHAHGRLLADKLRDALVIASAAFRLLMLLPRLMLARMMLVLLRIADAHAERFPMMMVRQPCRVRCSEPLGYGGRTRGVR